MMKLMMWIHNLWKIMEWETVDQVLIAGVWLLQRDILDHPFNDQTNVKESF